MVDAYALHHVIDVVRDIVEGAANRAAKEHRPKDDADRSTGARDGVDLRIADVSGAVVHAFRAGVRAEDGRLADGAGVEDAGAVDVGDVDSDARAIQGAYEIFPKMREAVMLVGPASHRGCGGSVLREVGEGEITNTSLRENIDALDVAVQHVGAFDARAECELSDELRRVPVRM